MTVAIIALFVLVVQKSYDLKLSEMSLLEKNDSLIGQKKIIDSLYLVTEEQLASLERATDSIYFNVARNTNTFNSYKNYVANYGERGAYYHKALVNLNAFFPNKGYVQVQESNGRKYYEKYDATKGFPEKAIDIVGEPSVSKENMFVLQQAMSVRKGVIGNPDFPSTGRNGDAISEGQIVKILDIIESGSAKWAHIAYDNR